jgi:hypothetical protein
VVLLPAAAKLDRAAVQGFAWLFVARFDNFLCASHAALLILGCTYDGLWLSPDPENSHSLACAV